MTTAKGQRMSPEMRTCINDCIACSAICTETVAHCLEKGGAHADAGLIRMLLDCAEMCRTSAGFMLRGSDMHERVCGVCAAVCARCAGLCDALANDPQMQACAEACLCCASSCKQMAARPESGVDWDKVSADSYPASDPPATMAGVARP